MSKLLIRSLVCLAAVAACAAPAYSSAEDAAMDIPALRQDGQILMEREYALFPLTGPASAEKAPPLYEACVEPDAGRQDIENAAQAAYLPSEALQPAAGACADVALDEDDALSIAAGTASDISEVPVVFNDKVASFVTYFQTRGRKHFERWLSRQPLYMSTITALLREQGLPEDLFYIAFIESGLNPTAKSRAKAVGMWQFIRGTAKKYGLRVDWWIDERLDPEKATVAASKYLKNLYGQFGSWYLAAAGYNAGEGRVMRAIRKHGTEDFWVLASRRRPLKRETREYVPKYLAAMMIAKAPEAYGFDAYEGLEAEPLEYDTVSIKQATDLRVIAEAAETTVEEIKALNPELLRWFTPPDEPDYELRLPKGSAERFYANIGNIPLPERLRFHTHTVRRGDTLSMIAKRYGTSVQPIQYLNNIKGVRLRPGSVIMIPVRANERAGKGKDIADAVITARPGTKG